MSVGGVIQGILLAAGAGTRFGGGKLLHELSDGTPIGVASWRHLVAALPDALVIVRAGDPLVAAAFEAAGARVKVCRDAYLGMGHSLACGVAATPDAAGWVIALADMPALMPASIAAVAGELQRGASIVVPTVRGERGHPVGFSQAHRQALLALTGDQGARSILQGHPEQVVHLTLNDGGVLQDVDTREDADRLKR